MTAIAFCSNDLILNHTCAPNCFPCNNRIKANGRKMHDRPIFVFRTLLSTFEHKINGREADTSKCKQSTFDGHIKVHEMIVLILPIS